MFKITPTPKNTYAKILSLSSLLLGAGLFIFANLDGVDYPVIPQLLGLILLTVSIYTASVFLLRRYTFSIDINTSSNDNELDLIIFERKGNREISVCRVGLKDIVAVREVNAQNKNQIKDDRKKMKCYTYDVSFIAPRRIEIICRLNDDDFSILITYDEQLLAALNNQQT